MEEHISTFLRTAQGEHDSKYTLKENLGIQWQIYKNMQDFLSMKYFKTQHVSIK